MAGGFTAAFPDFQHAALYGFIILIRVPFDKFGSDRHHIVPVIGGLIHGRQQHQEGLHLVFGTRLNMALSHHQIQALFQIFRLIGEFHPTLFVGFSPIAGRDLIPENITLQGGAQYQPVLFGIAIQTDGIPVKGGCRGQFSVCIHFRNLVNTELNTHQRSALIQIFNCHACGPIRLDGSGSSGTDRQKNRQHQRQQYAHCAFSHHHHLQDLDGGESAE